MNVGEGIWEKIGQGSMGRQVKQVCFQNEVVSFEFIQNEVKKNESSKEEYSIWLEGCLSDFHEYCSYDEKSQPSLHDVKRENEGYRYSP